MPWPSPRLAAFLLLPLILLSGCAGAGKPAATPPPQATARADAFSAADDGETGEIVGRVLDDEFRPLAEVLVRIVGSAVEAETTGDGVFYFPRLPGRAYTLAFSKPGYGAKNQSVAVAAQQRALVEVILVRAADKSAFVDDGFVFRGRINCSVRVNASGTNTNPECGQTNADTDVQRQRYMDLLSGVRWLLVEAAWRPSAPTVNDKLTLAIRPYQGLSWRQVEGRSPIRVLVGPTEWESIVKFSEKDYPRFGGQIQFMMFPGELVATGSAAVGATVQQDFTIYGTAWYRMDPPSNYTRLPPP